MLVGNRLFWNKQATNPQPTLKLASLSRCQLLDCHNDGAYGWIKRIRLLVHRVAILTMVNGELSIENP
jgi:hypothetical protein